ncbi:Universal stress family protein [Quillaja saponaria]|uniref:Universal stress family protein n=1 Tax=Quillaja saponaria TaxID=32244 RepID=A0AAD7VN16_QUISA|nr:Universal stress family protein [Quillaja saponaria]KAJ7981671.1 Universal stress family protein [Quillaja saponaria]
MQFPPQQTSPELDPQLPNIRIHHPSSPLHGSSAGSGASPTPTAGARRKIGVAVDLSDESAYAVLWAVHNYIRPGDAVILLHVSPTSVLFGADWGSIDLSINTDPTSEEEVVNNVSNNEHSKKLEDDFDAFTASKSADIAKPLKDAQIPYKIHIVKDHDMKERLCLEVERLGLSAVIMGSRGFGAVRRGSDGKLGSVSDYCVHHCVCPVVVVRYPDEKDAGTVGGGGGSAVVAVKEDGDEETVIKPVPAAEEHKKDHDGERLATQQFLNLILHSNKPVTRMKTED